MRLARIIIRISLCLLTAFLLVKSDWLKGLLAWFSLVPALMVVSRENPDASALYGALSGFAVGAFLFYGVIPYGFRYYLLLAFYCSLNGALISRTLSFLSRRYINSCFNAFIASLVWTSFEYLRTLTFISFPLSLGSSQSEHLELIQLVSIFGIYGLSFLVAFGNYTIFHIARWPNNRRSYILLAVFAILILSSFKFGQAHIEEPHNKRRTHIAVVQGGISISAYQRELYDDRYRDYITNKYLRLTMEAFKTEPDLIIWPEVSVNRYLDEDGYRVRLLELSKKSKAYLLLGAPEKENDKYYNSVFLISPAGEVLDKYRKFRPIPLSENYLSGGMLKPIDSPLGRFGVAICFESIYPSILRNLTRNGAEFLLILTNDAGFGYTPIPYLHAREALFRAVENRRWLVRAAQSGISIIIDPFGRVIKNTELGKKAILEGFVGSSNVLTFYTRFGDTFVNLCIIITLSILLKALFNKKIAFGDNLKMRFSVVRKVFYTFLHHKRANENTPDINA